MGQFPGFDESRRGFLKAVGSATAMVTFGSVAPVRASQVGSTASLGFPELPEGILAEQHLYALEGKVPLIKKTYRPPNFETPVEYFRTPITRNDAFFVRWHLSAIPKIDANRWSLAVTGDAAERELSFTLAELKKDFKPAQITAVNQCSGNRRGLFEPHVTGVQWGVGAMGNAVWGGVRLKDVLAKAGVKATAIEVVFDGADHGVLEKTPDFVKSLPLDVAMRDDTLIAFEMNGAPLPHWNGFPARLVVPGWTGTYWVKQLVTIKVVSQPDKSFWMSTAYRVPRGLFATPTFQSQLYAANEPITTIVVNSLITSLRKGQRILLGKPIDVHGIAWDDGSGIAKVEVSVDGGESWVPAKLGRDLGRYAFREFAFSVPVKERGSRGIEARATSVSGQSQVKTLIPNPAGYHHNVIQRVDIEII